MIEAGKRPFLSLEALILEENASDIYHNLVTSSEPVFILFLGCGRGKDLLRLSQDLQASRILGVDRDDFDLALAERLLKDRASVQLLNYKDFERRYSALDTKYDLVVVRQGFEVASPLQKMKDLFLKSAGALILIEEEVQETGIVRSYVEKLRSLGFSDFKEGLVMENRAE